MRALLVALVGALVGAPGGALAGAPGGAECGPAALSCRSGGCARPDAYCDGRADCADGSDEPAGCSPCNRTLQGRAGEAYSLAVRGAPRLPFLCHLTFTAGGGAHGDLVQLAFDEFRVGRYEAEGEGEGGGCPDGYMQLSELGRPFTGGAWCGQADRAALYYSDTSTVTVSVKLFRARLGEPFGFRLRYKFLSQRDAVVRFGPPSAPLERGAVSPGTYCTRTFAECHRAPCRLQSPNYPGMYPRNVTCYWSVRQRDVPTCKHAMISVRQDNAHKVHIKRSIAVASMNKTGRVVRAWGECTGARDRVLVYDGASTDDAVLLTYCGGDWLPAVTARGPDMLVAFHSAPRAAPLAQGAATGAHPLRGFELDVDVIFADSDSLDYAREARRCEFHVKASSSPEEGNATLTAPAPGRGRRGVLRAPAHTLPPNTTCTWTFHGRPGDLVWLYFSSFTQYSLVENGGGGGRRAESVSREEGPAVPPAPPCPTRLRLWEGAVAGGEGAGSDYCEAPPALCARAALANATRTPRPCAPPDGFVSVSSVVGLSVTSVPGTATHPLSFALHYEFVDARLPGAALAAAGAGEGVVAVGVASKGAAAGAGGAVPAECARLLTAPGAFSSPRNVLWFGRGGARALHCVWRLQPAAGPVRLRLLRASFGAGARCATRRDGGTGRATCAPPDGAPRLVLYAAPWARSGYRAALGCWCDNASLPLSLWSGGALELELVAPALDPREDQRALHFAADWAGWAEHGAAPHDCAQRNRLPPPGRHLHLVYPYEEDYHSECGETPFLLEARGNRSVFLRVWGHELPLPAPGGPPGPPGDGAAPPPTAAPLCHTANRVLVYCARSAQLVRAVCPAPPASAGGEGAPAVHVFSADWAGGGEGGGGGGRPGALLVVWAASERGEAALSWMEVWRPAGAGGAPSPAGAADNVTAQCAHACPALGACMPSALWCSGAAECPGGADEAGAGCGAGAGARLLRALRAPGAAAGALCVAAALIALGLLLAARRARGGRCAGGGGGGGKRRPTREPLCAVSRASSVAS